MNILRNDRVVLIKPFDKLQKVGESYEVANITDTAVILRDVVNKLAVGAINITVFDQYFKKPEEVQGWTNWQVLSDVEGDIIAYYRTNYKKVQVRTIGGFRAEASCNKCDTFELSCGISLAYIRCVIKILKSKKLEYKAQLKHLNSKLRKISFDIDAQQNMIKTIIKGIDNSKVEQHEV